MLLSLLILIELILIFLLQQNFVMVVIY